MIAVARASLLLGLAVAAVLGCRPAPSPYARDRAFGPRNVHLTALDWTAEGGVLFARSDAFGSGDAYWASCDSAGLYSLKGGRISGVVTVDPVCEFVGFGGGHELSFSRRRWEVVATPWKGDLSFLLVYAPRRLAVDTVHLPCRDLAAPAWSPDGRRIVITGRCTGAPRPAVYLVNRDGSHLRRLGAELDSSRWGPPAWSPDGRRLLVASGQPPYARILAVDTASRQATVVAHGYLPSWSPDGGEIAYVQELPGLRARVRVVGGAAGDRVLVSDSSFGPGVRHGAMLIGPPIWSPDGRALVLSNIDGLWIVNHDGTGLRRIVPGGRRPTTPR